MSRYIISPAASQDLDEISDYFLLRSIASGERFVNAFEQKCKNLVKFLNMGKSYSVGILMNPEKHKVEIYRLGEEVVILGDGDILSIPDLLPGWEIAVSDLWPLEF